MYTKVYWLLFWLCFNCVIFILLLCAYNSLNKYSSDIEFKLIPLFIGISWFLFGFFFRWIIEEIQNISKQLEHKISPLTVEPPRRAKSNIKLI